MRGIRSLSAVFLAIRGGLQRRVDIAAVQGVSSLIACTWDVRDVVRPVTPVSLFSPNALAELQGAAVSALVQPGVAIDSHTLASVAPDVNRLCYAFEHRKKPADPHVARDFQRQLAHPPMSVAIASPTVHECTT